MVMQTSCNFQDFECSCDVVVLMLLLKNLTVGIPAFVRF